MAASPGPLGQLIAAELRAELGRQRHTRRWLAQEIHAPQNTVNRWLAGETSPNLDALDAMCRALGTSLRAILAVIGDGHGFQPRPHLAA